MTETLNAVSVEEMEWEFLGCIVLKRMAKMTETLNEVSAEEMER